MSAFVLTTSSRKAETCVRDWQYRTVLAAIHDAQEGTKLAPGCGLQAADGYDTYANNLTGKPLVKNLRRPVTIRREVVKTLTSLLAAAVHAISVSESDPKFDAAESDDPLVGVVIFMTNVVNKMWPLLRVGKISEGEFFIERFSDVAKIVLPKPPSDPQKRVEILRIYMNFVRCVALSTAGFAVEHRTTLNPWFFRGVVRQLGSMVGARTCLATLAFCDAHGCLMSSTVPKKKVAASPAATAASPAAAAMPAAAATLDLHCDESDHFLECDDEDADPADPADPADVDEYIDSDAFLSDLE